MRDSNRMKMFDALQSLVQEGCSMFFGARPVNCNVCEMAPFVIQPQGREIRGMDKQYILMREQLQNCLAAPLSQSQ